MAARSSSTSLASLTWLHSAARRSRERLIPSVSCSFIGLDPSRKSGSRQRLKSLTGYGCARWRWILRWRGDATILNLRRQSTSTPHAARVNWADPDRKLRQRQSLRDASSTKRGVVCATRLLVWPLNPDADVSVLAHLRSREVSGPSLTAASLNLQALA